jgi:hypothetical protein
MTDDVTDYENAAAGFAANTNLNKLCADIAAQSDRLNKDSAGRKWAMEKLVDQIAAEFAERSRVFFVEEIPNPPYSDEDEPDADEEGEEDPADSADPRSDAGTDEAPEESDEGAQDGFEETCAPWLVDAGTNTKIILIKVKTWTDDWPVPVAGLKVYSHESEDGVLHIAGHDVEWKKVGGFKYDAHRRVWAGALEYLLFRLQCAVEEWMKTRGR